MMANFEMQMPDLFQKLWQEYILPGLTQTIGKVPDVSISFYSTLDVGSMRTNIMVDKFAEFLQGVFDIAAETAIVANKENKKLKERNEFLQDVINKNENSMAIGNGIITAINIYKQK